jgi:hypothetical protein
MFSNGIAALDEQMFNKYLEMQDNIHPLLKVEPSSLAIATASDVHGLYVYAPADKQLIIEAGQWITVYHGRLSVNDIDTYSLHEQCRVYNATPSLGLTLQAPKKAGINKQPCGSCNAEL